MIESNATNKIVKIVETINIIPPIVGVPSFFLCDSPTYSLIFCPKFILFNIGIRIKPNITEEIKPIIKDSTDFVKININPPQFLEILYYIFIFFNTFYCLFYVIYSLISH